MDLDVGKTRTRNMGMIPPETPAARAERVSKMYEQLSWHDIPTSRPGLRKLC